VSRFRVLVTLKPELLDTQGRAVNDALRSLGFKDLIDVRVGKLIEIRTQNGDKSEIDKMCRALLANPVIEQYTIEDDA
jgi:phosphoribosylformylglycinamidine synthase